MSLTEPTAASAVARRVTERQGHGDEGLFAITAQLVSPQARTQLEQQAQQAEDRRDPRPSLTASVVQPLCDPEDGNSSDTPQAAPATQKKAGRRKRAGHVPSAIAGTGTPLLDGPSSEAARNSSAGDPAGAGPETAAAAFGSPRPRVRRHDPVRVAVDVLPDRAGRLGVLSYLVPDDLDVRVGDAVKIPFGKREAHGLVVGPGDPQRATRPVQEVFGVRCDPSDVALALTVAKYHFSDDQTVLARLSPSSGRGAEPSPHADVVLADGVRLPRVAKQVAETRRTLLVRAPAVDAAELAAHQALDLATSSGGQILVLCPSTELVTRVVRLFASGAARLDAKAPRGAWKGFCEGTVTIGVGTRSAALYAASQLAGIVVVEEDHPGHIEATQPHTHARDLASARTRALRIPLRLTSACPTPQAVGAVTDIFAVGLRADWPRMLLVNRSDLDPKERLAPARLRQMLANARRAGHTPVVVSHVKNAKRRCTRCGTVRPCIDCDSSLCRHAAHDPCPTCASTDGVKMRGWDAPRLRELFGPEVKVVGIGDLSATSDAGVVVLFDIDAIDAMPDLVPGRLAASVIVAAAQAAGTGGTVVAMTDDGTQPVIVDLFGARDQVRVAKRFYSQARAAGLPPHGRLVTIRVERVNAPSVTGWPGHVYGPRKVADHWEILVRVANDEMDRLRPHVQRLRRGGKCRIQVT